MTFLDQLLDLEKTPLARRYGEEEYNLDRFRAFVESLGSPQRGLVFVHIAGTKGKGSTAALVEALSRGLGFPTVMFSSPHLAHFGERFRFNGTPWSAEEFAAACDRFWQELGPEQRRGFEGPKPWRTVFESLTAMALLEFQAFARRQPPSLPTVVAWETGLGGRLDCTNIVDPAVSVITALGLDHVAILGGTLEKIAGEKAGIIKAGRPAVISRQPEAHAAAVWPVLRSRAIEVGAPLIRAEEHNPVLTSKPIAVGQRVCVRLPDGREEGVDLPLRGTFQLANLEAAIAAVWQVHRLYRKGAADSFHIAGSEAVSWPGRMEVHRRPDGRTLILDGAHCPLSARAAGLALREMTLPEVPHLLFTMQRDKNAAGFLRSLAESMAVEPETIPLIVYMLGGPRGATGEELAAAAQEVGFTRVQICAGPAEALAATAGNTLVALGSLYPIDTLRALWNS